MPCNNRKKERLTDINSPLKKLQRMQKNILGLQKGREENVKTNWDKHCCPENT